MTLHEAALWYTPPAPEHRYLLEGPRVNGDQLLWVNIQTGPDSTVGEIWTRPLAGGEARLSAVPDRPGFVFPTVEPDVWLVGCGKSLWRYDATAKCWTPLATIPDVNPRTIINDGEIVPGGRAIVFGTKDTQFRDPIAHLFLFTFDDNRLTVLRGGQTCSNGKILREGFLWDIDSPTKTVVRYELNLDSRTLSEPEQVLDLQHREDFPDGMVDCGDGSAIIAFFNPHDRPNGEAVRFDLSTGEALESWGVPGSPRVTCPALVPTANGVKLILTTATEGMPAEWLDRYPQAGSLFIADTSFRVCPAAERCQGFKDRG
jgi:sugar lactone lactonase YvrE